MSDPMTCPRCAAALPAGAAPEDCPRCLLAAGLESVSPGRADAGYANDGGAHGGDGSAGPRPGATAPSPEEIGRHFPQLEVLELLGQGGMGIVYKARQLHLDRLVALKVMPPDIAREPGFADRFTREARTLARLQHANIVAIHDFGVSDGLYFLLMEFVDGANLRQTLRAGGLSASQALAIVPQVCDALQYAHENGVVHRDVKPENILIDRAGRVRIADFGLAKIVQRTPVDVTLTRAGQVMGTLHYMAPEQVRASDAVDHRADIYSLGVVFYEMLTGELPLGSFPPPSEKSGVDLRIDRVVMRALESERERRWQSASDVKSRISEIAAGPDAVAGASSPPPPPAPAAAPIGAPAGAKKTVRVDMLGLEVTKDETGAHVEVKGGAGGRGNVHIHASGQTTGPDGRPSRASRLATFGGLGVPAAIAAGLLVWVALAATDTDTDTNETMARVPAYVVCAVVAAGWIASLVAWVRIHHAQGALSGKAWAVTGTFLPFVFACCGGPFLFLSSMPLGIQVKDGPGGTHVRLPGIDVEEREDGSTRVRLPGIDVEEREDGSTRVRLPGIDVDDRGDGSTAVRVPGLEFREKDGRASVRVHGVAVGAADRAAADHVTGGPASLSKSDRASFAATMRVLWEANGRRALDGISVSGTNVDASKFRVFHLVVADDGASGRLVVTSDSQAATVLVVREGDFWSIDRRDEFRDGAPARDDDRDGHLMR